jgi:ABC-type polysaccharide/polyol phosphate export permease
MASATELWNYRSLTANLARREMRAQYKKSVLGSLWSLINPLSVLLIYALVFGTFLRIEPPVAGNGETKSFALFLFAALIIWNLFNASVLGGMGALGAAGDLLRKVYFPPECPIIAHEANVLVQTSMETVVIVVFLLIVQNVSWTFLLFPVVLLMVLAFSVGVALVVSLLNVYYRDTGYLVGIGLNLLFYCTPIIYPIDLVPEELGGLPARRIIELNPLANFTDMSRDLLYQLQMPTLNQWLYGLAWSVAMLLVGWRIFSRWSVDIGEEL